MSGEITVDNGNYLVYIPSNDKGMVDLNEVRTFKGTNEGKSFTLKASDMNKYLQSKGMGEMVSVIDTTKNPQDAFLGGKSSKKKAGKKTSKKGGRRRRKTQKSK